LTQWLECHIILTTLQTTAFNLKSLERQIKMATDKLFTVCGISKLGGEYKVRFANDTMRIKVLAKHGHEDIRLWDLETGMTKTDAVNAKLDEFQDVQAQAAIADYLDRNVKTAKVAAPKAKATAPKAPAKAKATAKVDTSALEDAPF
jgi:hypothetical protein